MQTQDDYFVIKDHSLFTIQLDIWLLGGSTSRTNTGLADSYQVKISDYKYRGKQITFSLEIALQSQWSLIGISQGGTLICLIPNKKITPS